MMKGTVRMKLWLALICTTQEHATSLSSIITNNSSNNSSNNNNNIHTLLLCRHGDSIWNGGQPGLKETFTGWTDVPLSQKGIKEASNTGKEVSSYTYGIDACFTSTLNRAKETAHYCLWAFSEKPHSTHPRRYVSDYRLNERHYGSLQGFVKHDVENGIVLDYTREQVKQWRRNWYAIPPLLDDNDPRRIDEIRKWSNFCGGEDNVPKGESLEMVAKGRIRPFLDDVLHPIMEEAAQTTTIMGHNDQGGNGTNGGTALVIAHANSLRALIGIICQVEKDDAALKRLEAMKIQTGVPLIMRYQKLDNGEYHACAIPEIENVLVQRSSSSSRSSSSTTSFDKRNTKSDLPVWPLSCLPKNNKSANLQNSSSNEIWNGNNNNNNSRSSSETMNNNKPIRIDVI